MDDPEFVVLPADENSIAALLWESWEIFSQHEEYAEIARRLKGIIDSFGITGPDHL